MGKVKEHLIELIGDNDINKNVYNATFKHPEDDSVSYGVADALRYFKGIEDIEEAKRIRNSEDFNKLMNIINDENNISFMELESLKLAKFLLNNLCFIIEKELSIQTIKKYRDSIAEVLISTLLVKGIYVPIETSYLKRIVRAFDYLLYYDKGEDFSNVLMKLDHVELYVYRVDLTRLISKCIPNDEDDDRILFEYLLKIPH